MWKGGETFIEEGILGESFWLGDVGEAKVKGNEKLVVPHRKIYKLLNKESSLSTPPNPRFCKRSFTHGLDEHERAELEPFFFLASRARTC